MALDPRIPLGINVPSNAPALNLFENALMNAQTRDLRQSQEERAQALAPVQLQQAQQGVDINQQAIDEQTENRIIRSVSEFGTKLKPVIESGNIDQAQGMLTNRLLELQEQGLPTEETVEAITALRSGNSQGVVDSINSIQAIAQQRGLFNAGQSVGQREFTSLTQGLSPEDKEIAARIKLGLDPKASLTGQERIALDEELGEKVVTQLEAESGAKESGKLKQQLKHKPAITRAIKLAEKAATEQGEVLTDLARAEAGLPGLIQATDNLKELASVATSTFGGRFFDVIAKESGWGSTKGANARAKYIAIIDNQVLPLLKQTFGAAMTEGEGLRLSNTLGDANASPEQKMLQTDAFIEQKLRDIERLKSQASSGANTGDELVDFSNASDDELFN